MLYGIIKQYESHKCVRIAIEKEGLFFSNYYEARIYTTQGNKTVPPKEDLEKVAKLIANANWAAETWQDYTHRTKIQDYPYLTIVIKKISKPTKEQLQQDETSTDQPRIE